MSWTFAPWFGIGSLLVALAIGFSPSVGQAQAPPPVPPTSPQGETPTEPTDQFRRQPVPGRQAPSPAQTVPAGEPRQTSPPEGQAQPPAQATPQTGRTLIAPGGQPQDPFQGSPLLRSFERRPDALAPLRQLRYAPLPDLPTPFGVNLLLTAEEEFTDNADQSNVNRRSEFSTRIVPGIAVQADRPWLTASLLYAPEVFIQGNSIGETEINQNLSLRGTLWPGRRFQFSLAEDFTDSNDFRDIEDISSRRTGSENFKRNEVTGEAAYVLPRLRTALAYTNIVIATEEDLDFTDTRIDHIVRPNFEYTDPRITVGGAYTLTRGDENSSIVVPYWAHQGDGWFRYTLSPTITPGVAGFYRFQEPDIGLHYSLGRGRATGTFGLGPDGTLDLAAGADVFAQQGFSTEVRPSVLVAYTHRFPVLAVTARYEQGFRDDVGEIDRAGISFMRSAGVFIFSSFFRDLTGTFGVQYAERTFEGTTVTGPTAGTTDRTWSVDLLLRYLLARSLFLTLEYNGTFRFSNEEADEFNENRVRLGVTYQYTLF